MAIGLLRRLAARDPVAVFAAIGRGAVRRVEALALAADVEWVASPRHASVLLVAGDIRADDRQALRTVHDQLPRLRATLWWGAEPFDGMSAPVTLAASDDPLPHLRELRRRLWAGECASEPDLLADEPPAPWRGVGDHGQGGKGMMGGKPYGRPMAMTADDLRDGLALDESTVRLGPFLPMLPPGLVLELTLQGDLVQRARMRRRPLATPPAAESAAQAGLRHAARLLALLQLGAHAERCRRAQAALERGDAVDLPGLRRALRRSGALVAIPSGLGRCRIGGVESDVRGRMQRWIDAESLAAIEASAMEPPWLELLAGLEWQAALIVVNSFTAAQLRLVDAAEDAD